jgi:hypothetical protein
MCVSAPLYAPGERTSMSGLRAWRPTEEVVVALRYGNGDAERWR